MTSLGLSFLRCKEKIIIIPVLLGVNKLVPGSASDSPGSEEALCHCCYLDHLPRQELSLHSISLLLWDSAEFSQSPEQLNPSSRGASLRASSPSPHASLLGAQSPPHPPPSSPGQQWGTQSSGSHACLAGSALAEALGGRSPQNSLANQLEKSQKMSKFRPEAVPVRMSQQTLHLC